MIDRVRNVEDLDRLVRACNEAIGLLREVVVRIGPPPANVVDIVRLSKVEFGPIELARAPSRTEDDRLLTPFLPFGRFGMSFNLLKCVEVSFLDRCLLLLLYLFQPLLL